MNSRAPDRRETPPRWLSLSSRGDVFRRAGPKSGAQLINAVLPQRAVPTPSCPTLLARRTGAVGRWRRSRHLPCTVDHSK